MEIRESDFEDMVLKSDRPVLVDFWASWCPPCKMMQPVVDRLALKVGDWADVYAVNIDRSPSLASQYQVSGVPTFICFAGGQAIDRKTGALTEGQMMNLLTAANDAMPPKDSEEVLDWEDPQSLVHDLNDDIEETLVPRPSQEPGWLGSNDSEPPAAGGSAALRPQPPTLKSSRDAAPARTYITIVSGLPRSGTSMMMRMLEAGGIPALTDDKRTPDDDNPNGYYEFEDVKSIEEDSTWIQRAPGHSVKMVYSLLKHLPSNLDYRVVFMRRNVEEILESQKKMLERNEIATDIPDATMKALFERELRNFYAWLPTQEHLQLINVSYNELLARPETIIAQINRHFDGTLDGKAMSTHIDPSLYRHRAA